MISTLLKAFESIHAMGERSSAVAKALCSKPEGRGFETMRLLNFSIYLIPPAALGPTVYSASNRNEYQKK
jgi:hypothetical protein